MTDHVPETHCQMPAGVPLALKPNLVLGVNAKTQCKCTFTQHTVGDGCIVCNPAKALEYAQQTIVDLRAHRDMLDQALREAIGIIGEMCTAYKHPEPEASMTRMQKALDFDA